MLAQVVDQHVQVHRGAAQPPVQRLALDRFAGSQLQHVRERLVGAEDAALHVRQHEGIRHRIDHVRQRGALGRAARRPVKHLGPGGRQPHQQRAAAVLLEQAGRQLELGVVVQTHQRVLAAAGIASLRQARIRLGLALHRQQLGEAAADDAFAAVAQQPSGRGVVLEHDERRRVEHEHGLIDGLKQQAVTRLGMTQAKVIALHRLLGIDQALLHRGDIAQVAAERDHPALDAQGHQAVADRQIDAPGQCVGDLARLRFAGLLPAGASRCCGEHRIDLAAALDRHRLDPSPADPLAHFRQFMTAAAVQRDVANDPLAVEHQRQIGCGSDHRSENVGIQVSEVELGSFEPLVGGRCGKFVHRAPRIVQVACDGCRRGT
mmetsp:Transcript_53737/g.126599  ORF Transcript_53737/g.126599 Transcript_53737/m.126599 type:complete len:376 (-) Transcript_53737:1819-2946(-)